MRQHTISRIKAHLNDLERSVDTEVAQLQGKVQKLRVRLKQQKQIFKDHCGACNVVDLDTGVERIDTESDLEPCVGDVPLSPPLSSLAGSSIASPKSSRVASPSASGPTRPTSWTRPATPPLSRNNSCAHVVGFSSQASENPNGGEVPWMSAGDIKGEDSQGGLSNRGTLQTMRSFHSVNTFETGATSNDASRQEFRQEASQRTRFSAQSSDVYPSAVRKSISRRGMGSVVSEVTSPTNVTGAVARMTSRYNGYSMLPFWAGKANNDIDMNPSAHKLAQSIEKRFQSAVRGSYQSQVSWVADVCGCISMQRYMLSPLSSVTICLDIVLVMLILYDCVTVPMLVFDPEETDFTNFVMWTSRVIWTVHMPRSFITGYLRDDATVEMDPVKVVKNYLRSWFIFDVIVVTADWVDSFSGSTALNFSGSERMIRLLKATRLLRILRIPQLITSQLNHTNSEIMVLWITIIKDTIGFIFLIHWLACSWYGIGTAEFIDHPSWLGHPYIDDSIKRDMSVKYTWSVHWSISNFIGSAIVLPANAVERGFSAASMVFAFIWSAAFVSTITAALTRLQILAGEQGTHFATFRSWLNYHNINSELSFRAMTCAKFSVAEKQRNRPEEEIVLLKLLSEPLLIELHYELHSKILSAHPFFRAYDIFESLVIQRVCHNAISEEHLGLGDLLFAEGQEPEYPRMFFVKAGDMLYLKDYNGDGDIDETECLTVQAGQWVCEPVLWARWIYHGTLRAASNCSVLGLSASTFIKMMSEHSQTPYPAEYAAGFVHALNEAFLEGEDIDDLLDVLDVNVLTVRIFPRLGRQQTGLSADFSESSGSPAGFSSRENEV